jgi:hypothetical protein
VQKATMLQLLLHGPLTSRKYTGGSIRRTMHEGLVLIPGYFRTL